MRRPKATRRQRKPAHRIEKVRTASHSNRSPDKEKVAAPIRHGLGILQALYGVARADGCSCCPPVPCPRQRHRLQAATSCTSGQVLLGPGFRSATRQVEMKVRCSYYSQAVYECEYEFLRPQHVGGRADRVRVR